jgi:hypothetical protein
MSSDRTIETPITGREALGQIAEPVQAPAQFDRAFNRREPRADGGTIARLPSTSR